MMLTGDEWVGKVRILPPPEILTLYCTKLEDNGMDSGRIRKYNGSSVNWGMSGMCCLGVVSVCGACIKYGFDMLMWFLRVDLLYFSVFLSLNLSCCRPLGF